jgi:DNA-binding Lrp family transcriptional regulator
LTIVICVKLELDATDHRLLQLLSQNARATYSELAPQVGLSIAATKRRIDRLCADGVITGFTTQIDHTKLGWVVSAFTGVRFVGTVTPSEMIRSISQIPEVESVFTIAGDPDMIVSLRARDHTHLRDVITQLRQRDNAMGTRTMIVLESWHNTTPPSLPPRARGGESPYSRG